MSDNELSRPAPDAAGPENPLAAETTAAETTVEAAAAALELGRQQVRHMKKNWPFYWVSRVNGRYVQVLERRLKRVGIDMPRWRVLISLYEAEYLSISEIAEMSVMKLNTATKIVQRLVQDEMVVSRVRPNDGRVTEVTLTAKGDALRALALVEAESILAASFVHITPKELASLNAILEKVLGQLECI